MIEYSVVARVRRGESLELGMDAGVRPFHALALAHKDRQEVMELIDKAVLLFPSDHERRGEYLRKHAREL